MPVDVSEESFAELVGKGSILLDVWGPQCAPCLALMPEVEALEERYHGQIQLLKLNAAENRKLCRSLRIAGLPAYVTFRDGMEVERVTGGSATVQNIASAIDRLLAGAPARGLPVPEHLREGGEYGSDRQEGDRSRGPG
jgi:thioredoxin 1